MSLVVGDVYKATFYQKFLGQNLLNVQYYVCDEAGSLATEASAAGALFALWVARIEKYLSTLHQLVAVQVDNVSDGIGIGMHTPPPVSGQVTGDAMPAFVTQSIQQNRATRLTRHGHKYLGGFAELSIANGTSTLNAQQLADYTAMFAGPSSIDAGGPDSTDHVFRPVIVGRTPVAPGSRNYALDLSKINDITGITYRGVSTENLRKPGKGF